jgi:hypothetical protein
MKRYKYLSMTVETMWGDKQGFINYTSLNLYCTHVDVLDWLIDKAKIHAPKVELRHVQHDVTGTTCFLQLHRLDGNDERISRWLFRELCEGGWEPFDVVMTKDFQVMHLRYQEEAVGTPTAGNAVE